MASARKFGLTRMLDVASVYSALSDAVAGSARSAYVNEYVHPRPGDRILDIGCGPAAILDSLPADVEYVGFDENADCIRTAQSRGDPRAKFACKRLGVDEVTDGSKFDIVLATGVLHHLDDDDATRLLRISREALKPGGRLLTLDGCFHESQPTVARLLLRRDRGQFVRDQSAYTDLARSVFPQTRSWLRQDLLRIPYSLLVMECRT